MRRNCSTNRGTCMNVWIWNIIKTQWDEYNFCKNSLCVAMTFLCVSVRQSVPTVSWFFESGKWLNYNLSNSLPGLWLASDYLSKFLQVELSLDYMVKWFQKLLVCHHSSTWILIQLAIDTYLILTIGGWTWNSQIEWTNRECTVYMKSC